MRDETTPFPSHPAPGTVDALIQGCRCEVLPEGHVSVTRWGTGRGGYRIHEECPFHGRPGSRRD